MTELPVVRYREALVDILRRHFPVPTEGTFSACAWCGHTWMSDGPLGGCDEFYKAARALGFTTTEEARGAVTQRN